MNGRTAGLLDRDHTSLGAWLSAASADLSMSIGAAPRSPDVPRLIASTITEAHAAGKKRGLAYGSVPDRAARAVRDGCDFVVLSHDASVLAEAARDLMGAFRAQLSQ